MFYLNTFFIYSVLGFLFETIVAFITKNNFKSGILYGYWTPVYGIGALIILIVSKYLFKNLHMNRILETIIVFIIVSIVLSTIELIGGVLIEKIFHKVFWDYSNQKYSIGHYASLMMTFIWGIASIIFIYIINPLLENLIKKIPSSITIVLLILFIIDCVFTFINKNSIV